MIVVSPTRIPRRLDARVLLLKLAVACIYVLCLFVIANVAVIGSFVIDVLCVICLYLSFASLSPAKCEFASTRRASSSAQNI